MAPRTRYAHTQAGIALAYRTFGEGQVPVLTALGLEIRAGLHTGVLERLPDGDVAGVAVHLASRVMHAAGAGDVVATGTVKDLVVGSGITFAPRGTHVLRGVPGEWPLWEVPA